MLLQGRADSYTITHAMLELVAASSDCSFCTVLWCVPSSPQELYCFYYAFIHLSQQLLFPVGAFKIFIYLLSMILLYLSLTYSSRCLTLNPLHKVNRQAPVQGPEARALTKKHRSPPVLWPKKAILTKFQSFKRLKRQHMHPKAAKTQLKPCCEKKELWILKQTHKSLLLGISRMHLWAEASHYLS